MGESRKVVNWHKGVNPQLAQYFLFFYYRYLDQSSVTRYLIPIVFNMKKIKINDIFPQHKLVDQKIPLRSSIQNINKVLDDKKIPGECRNTWKFLDYFFDPIWTNFLHYDKI
jgi:hypothetical protein